ncbi:hypothetical protein ACQ3I4_04225 [Zafaria sp. Z1313]|uniref:hypothetical protein n=1 Tax=Zafaria sp. Z1313 TaxID=3423202 RepID=UPI003D3026F6
MKRTQVAGALRTNAGLPTVVSFFGGDRYYFECAAKLRSDCERLGLPHHIEEVETAGLEWPDICRLKIGFFRRMHKKYGAILWMDVDNRILKVPTVLEGCQADMAGFVGRRSYIRDYDPYRVTRFWIPSVLYFGSTERAGLFLDALVRLEASTDDDVTDDWVLHETWKSFEEELNVLLLAPSLLAREHDAEVDAALFWVGDSGHVSEYRTQVVQHQPKLRDVGLRGQALAAASIDAMRSGNRAEASVLAHYAYRYLPDDKEAAVRLSNYLSVNGNSDLADEVLREFVRRHPQTVSVREALVRRMVRRGDFGGADELVNAMVHEAEDRVKARGEALQYEVGLDRQAASTEESPAQRPMVWWSRAPYPGHFSEVLKPWIVDRLLSSTPQFGSRQRSLLLGEGTLANTTASNVVWGGGIRSVGERPSAEARYLAVRGPRTRRAIVENGGECPEVYGDPALLLPMLIPRERPSRRRNYIGLLTGPRDYNAHVSLDGVRAIDPIGTAPAILERVIDEVLHCHGVLTTSLTGLMIAHAYGVPVRWCVFGHHVAAALTDGEDFHDYFEAFDLPTMEPFDLSTYRGSGRDLMKEIPSAIPPPRPSGEYLSALRELYNPDDGSRVLD